MSKGTGPLSKIYNAAIGAGDKIMPQAMMPFWQSPAGPKTVFFWAPLFKWGLVFAGLGDTVSRPPQLISVNQCAILALTGVLWSRYSFVITPKNYNLLAVNVAVACIQSFLIAKHLKWRSENAKNTVYEYSYYPHNPDDDW